MKLKCRHPENKWSFDLMQTISDNGRFTYRPDYDPLSYNSNLIAIFKVKLKDRRHPLFRFFDFGQTRKRIEKHLVISQLHPC